MISRRSFLSMAAGSRVLVAQRRGGAQGPQMDEALPASVAALMSMRDQARPSSSDERRARIEKGRRLMAGQKSDALLLSGCTSIV